MIVEERGQKGFFIKGGQKSLPRRIRVEGDWSNAVFADSFNLLGGKVKVTGLSDGSVQGDRVYKTLFERIEKRDYPIDLSDCPDLAPMTFALAAAKGGGSFTGTARLRIKESDRAEAMREELSKFGVTVTVGENGVTVGGEGLKAPVSELCGHNDHRIVMALTVLCTLTGGTINGAQAVSKSYPGFFEMIAGLGIRIKVEE